MTNKAHFCAFLWLSITVLSRLKIKVCPKGLRNFAFYILIFDFLLQSKITNLSSLNPHPSTLAPNVIVRKYLRLCKALYICRDTFTDVMSALQIHLFMQNKAKFKKVKSNVNKVLTKDYEQMDTWSRGTKQSQTNPNKAKTNPILANKTTIRTQFKPNLSRRSLWRSRKQTQFQGKNMLNLTIDPRPKSFGCYENRRLLPEVYPKKTEFFAR